MPVARRKAVMPFRVDPQTGEALKEAATRLGRSYGDVLREAVRDWLKRHPPPAPARSSSPIKVADLPATVLLLRRIKGDTTVWAQAIEHVTEHTGVVLTKDQLKTLVEIRVPGDR